MLVALLNVIPQRFTEKAQSSTERFLKGLNLEIINSLLRGSARSARPNKICAAKTTTTGRNYEPQHSRGEPISSSWHKCSLKMNLEIEGLIT